MSKKTTFKNLQILEQARNVAREQLKGSYFETVQSFVKIIEQVAKSNNENHFEAMRRINLDGGLVDTDTKKIMFSAALMEIVEEKNLSEFTNQI